MKKYPLVVVIALGVCGIAIGLLSASRGTEQPAYRFTLTIQSPGQERVVLAGTVLGHDMALRGRVGDVETVNLLTNGELYVLTPAIRTARRIDNPEPPDRDAEGWPEWLLEPGRVNPLTFSEMLGEGREFDGEVAFSEGRAVRARFEDGRLILLTFPSPDGGGTVTYAYSDYEEASDLEPSDFRIPEGYRR